MRLWPRRDEERTLALPKNLTPPFVYYPVPAALADANAALATPNVWACVSNPNNPLTGVFNTRSPDRPNPLGLHPVTVREIDGNLVCASVRWKPSTERRSSTSSPCCVEWIVIAILGRRRRSRGQAWARLPVRWRGKSGLPAIALTMTRSRRDDSPTRLRGIVSVTRWSCTRVANQRRRARSASKPDLPSSPSRREQVAVSGSPA